MVARTIKAAKLAPKPMIMAFSGEWPELVAVKNPAAPALKIVAIFNLLRQWVGLSLLGVISMIIYQS